MHCPWGGDARLRSYWDRTDLERDLGRALSRHIGYTTGAYFLERIVSTLDIFCDRPSAYINELVEKSASSKTELASEGSGSHTPNMKYLSEVANFAESIGLIFTVSQKSARLRRFAPTELGRALLGAQASSDDGFYNYFLSRTVLLADADALVPVLKFFSQPSNASLYDYYWLFQCELRKERASWLQATFPERHVLERMITYIPWLSMPARHQPSLLYKNLSEKTAKHHAAPRQGWLQRLELIDANSKKLTPLGRATLDGLTLNCDFFWLGPNSTTQDALGIQLHKQKDGPYQDTFGLVASETKPRREDVNILLEDTADVMRAGYGSTKLVHAEQATLVLPIEFVKYRSFVDEKSYSWEEIVAGVFDKYRGEFERLSAKRGRVGFYKWKGTL